VDQAAGANDASPTVTVAAAKDLIERGRQLFDELAKIVERAEAEDSKPDAAAEESKSGAADDSGEPSGAAILMEQAEDMLSRGLYAEAVNLAHRAYAEASFDHDIFTAMLNVHVNAAALLDQQEKYADAIHLLMCAHSHDRTDRTVQRALAARHLQHARAMRGHDDAAAIEAVKEALRFDPKHPEAVAMFDELSGVQAGKAE
jgi:tetratricopeptide (TPR) repeat protein